MTTNEFIELLRKEDPEGTAHIRLEGGTPKFVERKPGYYDGPYTYLDDKGRLITSTKGSKVDVHCVEIATMIWDELEWNSYIESEEEAYRKAHELFGFDFSGYSEDMRERKEQEERKRIDKEIAFYVEHNKIDSEKLMTKTLDRLNEGWTYYKKDGSGKTYYEWRMIEPSGKIHKSVCLADTEAIVDSGLFEEDIDLPSKMEGYRPWRLKRDASVKISKNEIEVINKKEKQNVIGKIKNAIFALLKR